MSKRKQFHDFYTLDRALRTRHVSDSLNRLQNGVERRSITASAADRYAFRGTKFVEAAIVRVDLNQYTKWSSGKAIERRVGLLDEFFSFVVAELDRYGGVFFRDEGDCVVAVFSNYFDPGYTAQKSKDFCKAIVGRSYAGADQVTAKAVVSFGAIAIYQKAHEVGSDDWSAEGEPFIQAARLEQAVPSRPTVYYFEEEYDKYLPTNPNLNLGSGRAPWQLGESSLQVPGLFLSGGWAKVKTLDYQE